MKEADSDEALFGVIPVGGRPFCKSGRSREILSKKEVNYMLTIAVLGYIVVSILLGSVEIGLFVQPFLNFGLGYLVARHRGCDFRRMDALKILFATGTVLVAAVAVVLPAVLVLGPFIGLINAMFSMVYITPKVHKMFPKGGRTKEPSLIEDVKDLIDERRDTLDLGKDN
jgi:hypothetical protein